MDNLREKDLDALFQDGAEHQQFEYNPAAWDLMEEKLDLQEKNRRRKWIIVVLIPLFALLVGIIGYTTHLSSQQKTSEINDHIVLTSKEKDNSIREERKVETKNMVTDNKYTFNNTHTHNNPAIQSSTKKTPFITSSIKKNAHGLTHTEDFKSLHISNNSTTDLSDSEAQSPIIFQKQKRPFNSEQQNRAQVEIQTLNALLEPLMNTNKIKGSPDFTSKNIKSHESIWSLSIYANPEWSSIGWNGRRSMGYSFGTRIGINLSEKIVANIGVGLSKKVYQSSGQSYNMESGWVGNVEPMVVDAKCHIMEIPLSITYHQNSSTESGFFYGLGLSNYMIHSEWYGFTYDEARVLPNSIDEVQENNQNKHLVGVGSIQFGYQHAISRRTFFQVSPYLQFPLTGIGAGKANLYSSGIQLAIKFQ